MRKKLSAALAAGALVMLTLCGALTFSGRARAAEPVALPILMYHHISKAADQCGKHVISPQTLEGDLQYLADNGYTAVTTADLIAYVDQGKALPEKPVMITFDEGQLSVLEDALPLLERYDSRAVAAIVGAYADLYTGNEDRNINYACMTWEDVKKLSQSGRVEIANHTYDMHNLDEGRKGCHINSGESSSAYEEAFTADLLKNQQKITRAIGCQPLAFAYPFGILCDEAREVLEQQGYRVAFTCTEAVNQLTGDPAELMELCRYNRSNNVDRASFFAQWN